MLRFAPSPTGDMHIGNLRVALLNYIVSKQKNEPLVIRIEDTDKKRNIDGKDKEILELLNLFGIEYYNVTYQSSNLRFHQQFAAQLLQEKKAFCCFCTEDELQSQREIAKKENRPYRYSGKCENLTDSEVIDREEPFSIRVIKPKENIKFKDLIKGEFEFSPFDIDSFVILRQDKTPTYNFACAIDDMLSDISIVIRGEDHLSNTPKQIYIRKLLGFDKEIVYAHLPIILNKETNKKMSKRDNASSVKWLIDEGFLPSAIANYLVLLGYNPPKEIFEIEEAIDWFDIGKISKSPAKFDIEKLRFINREHIKRLDNLRLSKILGFSDSDIGLLAKIYLEEASTIKEIKQKIDKIFSKKDEFSEFNSEIKLIKKVLQEAPIFDSFDELKNYIIDKTSLKGKKLFMPLRFLLTGATKGPKLNEIYPYIKNYLLKIV